MGGVKAVRLGSNNGPLSQAAKLGAKIGSPQTVRQRERWSER